MSAIEDAIEEIRVRTKKNLVELDAESTAMHSIGLDFESDIKKLSTMVTLLLRTDRRNRLETVNARFEVAMKALRLAAKLLPVAEHSQDDQWRREESEVNETLELLDSIEKGDAKA